MWRILELVLGDVVKFIAPLLFSNNVECMMAGMQSPYPNGSLPPGAITLKLVYSAYP